MGKPNSDVHSRKKAAAEEVEKRIVVIDQSKCKPNSAAFAHLKRHAGGCGKHCITATKKTVSVAEWACSVCVNRCKQCPGDAVSVVKLPTNLTTDTTHRYGINSFKLHGLPTPRPGHVLGLLGTNGTGKSTALNILSARLKPNLGIIDGSTPEWADIVKYYRGSDLQNFFSAVLEDRLPVVTKPQLSAGFGRRFKVLTTKDDRGMMARYAKELDIEHLLDREIPDLSGGELQRFTVACVLCREADVYMFDEVTSFLDVRQRLRVTELIRSLVHDGDVEWPNSGGKMASMKKYVIVVEHDLAILDYMSDYLQCLYGQSGAYGVVTGRLRVRQGINQFLAGYIAASNMRFRANQLTFKVTPSDFEVVDDDVGDAEKPSDKNGKTPLKRLGVLRYPDMTQVRSRRDEAGEIRSKFTLHVKAGNFRDGECIALLGENGTGKSTFMEMLAGKTKGQRGKEATIGSYQADNNTGADEDGLRSNPSLASLGVAYKTQGLDPKLRRFDGTVSQILEQEINTSLGDRLFRLLVLRALSIDEIMDLSVKSLSGGEMQRLSIAICLGTPALVYLIDEPSAGLDCEQRVICAQAMKRWVVNHLGRTIFLVEHDFVMAAAMADRIIVYSGQPGIECTAGPPMTVSEGFNSFLRQLDVTFRRDPINFRPRINKKNSRLDQAQKSAGEYYLFDVDEVEDDDF